MKVNQKYRVEFFVPGLFYFAFFFPFFSFFLFFFFSIKRSLNMFGQDLFKYTCIRTKFSRKRNVKRKNFLFIFTNCSFVSNSAVFFCFFFFCFCFSRNFILNFSFIFAHGITSYPVIYANLPRSAQSYNGGKNLLMCKFS